MAKDGTMRGGQRVGAGRKSKALTDKIADGRLNGAMVLPEPAEIEGADVPPVKEYLKAAQKNGKDLCAEEVYRDTWNWLKARGCEMLVNNQLIEAVRHVSLPMDSVQRKRYPSSAFWPSIPPPGNAIASPYVAMSQTYMKQVNQVWYQIYQIVKENCAVEYGGRNPQDDLMERLLTARKGN